MKGKGMTGEEKCDSTVKWPFLKECTVPFWLWQPVTCCGVRITRFASYFVRTNEHLPPRAHVCLMGPIADAELCELTGAKQTGFYCARYIFVLCTDWLFSAWRRTIALKAFWARSAMKILCILFVFCLHLPHSYRTWTFPKFQACSSLKQIFFILVQFRKDMLQVFTNNQTLKFKSLTTFFVEFSPQIEESFATDAANYS